MGVSENEESLLGGPHKYYGVCYGYINETPAFENAGIS